MSTLLLDLRVALRSSVRAPRFSVPAILALALGTGATSATVSVVRGVMLEPLPYRDPDRIVTIWETNQRALFAAGAATRVLQTLLHDTEPRDPSTFAIAAVVLMAVAVLASYVPARRGTRIALAEALHPEQ
jgi:hypothetical protein